MNIIDFNKLNKSDLAKDCICKGGDANNLSSEPISKIFPVDNQSGIRFAGTSEQPSVVVLYSTFSDIDWPDLINDYLLTYYGDNKEPGREIHETPGNKLFRGIFNNLHLNKRYEVPPIFLFSKGVTGFDRIFKGLLVPGSSNHMETEDLIAIWKTKNNQRFQNYKAIFTLLPVQTITRRWIDDIATGNKLSQNSPEEWREWITK